MKIFEKIKNWQAKKEQNELTKGIYLDVNLMINYSSEDKKDIRDYIKKFYGKFFPNIEDQIVDFDINEEDFENLLTKEQLKTIKNPKKITQFQSLFVQRVTIQNFEEAFKKSEEFNQLFIKNAPKNLKFKVSSQIDFSDILNLEKEKIRLLQKEVFSKLKYLNEIDFVKMSEGIEK